MILMNKFYNALKIILLMKFPRVIHSGVVFKNQVKVLMNLLLHYDDSLKDSILVLFWIHPNEIS